MKYIVFIILFFLSALNAYAQESFTVFSEANFFCSTEMPVAVQINSHYLKEIPVSATINDKNNKICSFGEGITNDEGFACIKLTTPNSPGEYNLTVSAHIGGNLKTKELSLKLAKYFHIILNCVPVEDKKYIYILGQLKENDNIKKKAKCKIAVFKDKKQVHSEFAFTNSKGYFFSKIPATGTNYLIKVFYENTVKEFVVSGESSLLNYKPSDNIVKRGKKFGFHAKSSDILVLRKQDVVADYIKPKKAAFIEIDTSKLDGTYYLEVLNDSSLITCFSVITDKKNITFDGVKTSYLPGEPVSIKISPFSEDKLFYALFSNNLIDETSHQIGNIQECFILEADFFSFKVPFDSFKGFISFFDLESGLLVSQPFYVKNDFSVKLPALDYGEFTQGDQIKFPVEITNYTSDRGKTDLTFAEKNSFKIEAPFKKSITLEPYEKGYAYYNVVFDKISENIKIALGTDFLNSYKEIRGNLSVKPAGYKEIASDSSILSDNLKISGHLKNENVRKIHIYNNISALAEETLSILKSNPCFSSFNLIGNTLIAKDFDISSDDSSYISNFLNDDNSISLYRFENSKEDFLTCLAFCLFPEKVSLATDFESISGLKKLICYFYLKRFNLKSFKDFKYEKTGEPVRDSLGFYLTDSFSKENVKSILSKISCIGKKQFFHVNESVLSDIDTSLSDLEATALISYLIPNEHIDDKTKLNLLHFLLESRLPDGTWGNSMTSYTVLCAIKKLTDNRITSGEISIIGENFKEELKFYEESSVKIFKLPSSGDIKISCNNGEFFYFYTDTFYNENLSVKNKMISFNFSENSLKTGDKFRALLKWNFADKKSKAVISFNVPWGTIFSESLLNSLVNQQKIHDFIYESNKVYLLVEPQGAIDISFMALFPCRIYVNNASIKGALNSRITGTGFNTILEIGE